MTTGQFTFPPPPPPPPQATQSYSHFSQRGQASNSFGGQGRGGHRGGRGQWRGPRGGVSRGGHTEGPRANSSHNDFRYGYNGPLPAQGVAFNGQSSNQAEGEYSQLQFQRFPVQQSSHAPQASNNYGYGPTIDSISPLACPTGRAGENQFSNLHAQQGLYPSYPQFPSASSHYHNGASPLGQNPPSDPRTINHAPRNTYPSQQAEYPTRNFGLHTTSSERSSRHIDRGRGQKRGYGQAFGRFQNQNPKSQVAPAVPSFGAPLPLSTKPPRLQEASKKPINKKRKYNLLGLTPQAGEHESSEEEDDADEELRLATVAGVHVSQVQKLQFTFKGQTSTLNSPSDTASWIEERRKNFPTKARVAEIAERKRQRDEAQKTAYQARKETRENQQAQARERQRQKAEEKDEKRVKKGSDDATVKSKRKVEKLRRQLDREEKKIAETEAIAAKTAVKDAKVELLNDGEAGRKRKRQGSDGNLPGLSENHSPNAAMGQAFQKGPIVQQIQLTETVIGKLAVVTGETVDQSSAKVAPDPLTPTSQPQLANDESELASLNLSDKKSGPLGSSLKHGLPRPDTRDNESDYETSLSELNVDTSSIDSDDLTSSSGGSYLDDTDEPPEQISTKRKGPEKVLPPKREMKKSICRDFLRSGRCRRGDNCKFRHELPEKGTGTKKESEKKGKVVGRRERIGLYQRLVEQEKEKEDHDILTAIIHLGDKGLLTET